MEKQERLWERYWPYDDWLLQTAWLVGIFLAVVFLLTNALTQLLFVLIIGVAVGYSISPSVTSSHSPPVHIDRILSINSKDSSSTTTLQSVQVSETLDPILNELLDLFLRDFIRNWYENLNHSKSLAFENQTRSALSVALMNLLNYLPRDLPSSETSGSTNSFDDEEFKRQLVWILYGVANTLIIHSREYRQFELSAMEWDHYLTLNEHSSAQTLFTRRQLSDRYLMERVLDVSGLLVDRLLQGSESGSACLRAIVKELVATSTLWPIVCHLARADTIHQMILDLFYAIYIHPHKQQPDPTPTKTESVSTQKQSTKKDTSTKERQEQPGEEQESSVETSPIMARRITHHKKRFAHPDQIQLNDILSHNDLFALFMEYMDSVNAPPYLRFYTNVDIFRQLSLMAVEEAQEQKAQQQVLQTIHKDAMAIFNAHLSSSATLPIRLVSLSTLGDRLTVPIHDRAQVETLLTHVHQERAQALKNILDNQPNAQCFDEVLKFVVDILDMDYFAGFKKSDLFLEYCRNGHSMHGTPQDDHMHPPVSAPKLPSLNDGGSVSQSMTGLNELESGMTSMQVSKSDLLIDEDDLSQAPSTRKLSSGDEMTEPSLSPTNNTTIATTTATSPQQPASSQEKAILHLAEAITQIRERHNLTVNQIQELQSSPNRSAEINTKLKQLHKARREMVREIEMMVRTIEDMINNLDESPSVGASGSSEPKEDEKLVLTGVNINVMEVGVIDSSPATASNESPEKKMTNSSSVTSLLPKRAMPLLNPIASLADLGKKMFDTAQTGIESFRSASVALATGSLSSRLKNLVFLIQVERNAAAVVDPGSNSTKSAGWLLARSYADLVSLHNQLKASFTKVSKIPLPALPKSTMTNPMTNEERLNKLRDDVGVYLRMIVSDQLLCEARCTQHFFKPDGGHKGLGGNPTAGSGSGSGSQESLKRQQSIGQMGRQRLMQLVKSLPRMNTGPGQVISSAVSSPTSAVSDVQRRDLHVDFSKAESLVDESDMSTVGESPISPPHGSSAARLATPKKSPTVQIPTERLQPQPQTTQKKQVAGQGYDLSLLIDTVFGLVAELFDLSARNQWLRRKAFQVLRQLLLQQSIAISDMFDTSTPFASSSQQQKENNNQVLKKVDAILQSTLLQLHSVSSDGPLSSGLQSLIDWLWPPPKRLWRHHPDQQHLHAKPLSEAEQLQKTEEKVREVREWIFAWLDGTLEDDLRALSITPSNPTSSSAGASSSSSLPGIPQGSFASGSFYFYRLLGRSNTDAAVLRLLDMFRNEQVMRSLVVSIFEVVLKVTFAEDRRRMR